ncbi:trafficking protein particle complex subunit 10 [Scheffersomyces xylosifermentans]|uniref:trafficking protein particle complex subunit 10 n=1 Tax=Scheffersomyces xylosifermentans TaxID=1304137 RepID=UPI00315D765C
MFVQIEHMDTYRSQVRPLIKEWLKNLVLNSRVEWMIVLYIPPTAKDKHSTIIKTSYFDKLKIDFGEEGKELPSIFEGNSYPMPTRRIFKVKGTSDSNINRLEQYNDLISNLKDLLITSFSNNYRYLSDRLAGNKAISLDRFHTRLNLADLLHDMRLFQDSFDTYMLVENDLNQLYSTNKSLFDLEIRDLPKSFSKYKFESSFQSSELSLSLTNKSKINLFRAKCVMFKNQSVLLQSLANFANTISISAIFISNLLQKLIYFLNDISNTFPESNLNEFVFCVIDNYLNLPICNKLIEVNTKNNESDEGNNYQLHEILEFKGELKLFQRSKLIRIAEAYGYRINGPESVLEDIPLDDSPLPKTVPSPLSYPPIISAVATEGAFYSYFESVTEQIIQDMVFCGRTRTIDLLSIDLALLNYQRGNYQESLNILEDSYEFFIVNGWNFMGGFLLEIYLDSIQKLKNTNHEHILLTSLKLLSTLIENCKNNVTFGINSYRLIKSREQIQKLYDNVVINSSKLENVVDYPLESIFHTEISPYFHEDNDTPLDRYFLQFEITNLFDLEFEFEAVELHLINKDLEEICFSNESVKLKSKTSQTVKLFSNSFKLGNFGPSRLTVRVNENLQFSKEFESYKQPDRSALDANATVIQSTNNSVAVNESNAGYGNSKSKFDDIYFHQSLYKLRLDIKNTSVISLGTTELLVQIQNGDNTIENVQVELISLTEGVKLDFGTVETKLDKLEKGKTHDLIIPYKYYNDNKVITLQADVIYTVDGETFSHSLRVEVDTTLTISVSVQDIFKTDFIYSKFQVGTSNPKLPIRVISNSLSTKNAHYSITKPMCSVPSLVTFGEQPASFFYKIIPDYNYSITSSDMLDLVVEYSNLADECDLYLNDKILTELQAQNLEKHWFIFKNLALQKVTFDLNNYGIKQFIKAINRIEVGMLIKKLIFKYVEKKEDQDNLVAVFDTIFGEEMYVQPDPVFVVRKLFISVPVPVLRYLQILDFEYERKARYLVGEPISMKLKVETVTKWFESKDEIAADENIPIAESSPEKINGSIQSKTEETFQMLVQNDDNWLVSGFKKYNFSIENDKKSNSFELELVMIPLNVGKVLLPRVTIKSLASKTDVDTSMDMEIRNGIEALLIVPELESITFSL